MANKLIKCKSCGADIAKSAKTCPQCGAKNKKPIYKKWWFYAILVIILLGGMLSQGDGNTSLENKASDSHDSSAITAPSPVQYTHYKVTELFDVLNENALNAKNMYKGQYVELEGYLGTIDSDGKYIAIDAGDDMDYLFESIQCYMKSDEQKQIVMSLKSGDPIIIRGRITDVGEVLGYTLNIDSIN